jgi:peptide deformylase
MNLGSPEAVDRVLIDPEILEARGQVVAEEGCLSFPSLYAKIQRAEWIRYRAMDLQGVVEEREASGLEARVIQHEIDHLDGILFLKRMSPAEKQSLAGSLRELEREWQEQHPESRKPRPKARTRR